MILVYANLDPKKICTSWANSNQLFLNLTIIHRDKNHKINWFNRKSRLQETKVTVIALILPQKVLPNYTYFVQSTDFVITPNYYIFSSFYLILSCSWSLSFLLFDLHIILKFPVFLWLLIVFPFTLFLIKFILSFFQKNLLLKLIY